MNHELIRTWEEGPFKLDLFDTGEVDDRGASRLAYMFYCEGKLIFQGEDYHCSPLASVDGDRSVSGLLTFLSLKPGDTDREYFQDYTEEQMDFAREHGEELSLYAMELEERNV